MVSGSDLAARAEVKRYDGENDDVKDGVEGGEEEGDGVGRQQRHVCLKPCHRAALGVTLQGGSGVGAGRAAGGAPVERRQVDAVEQRVRAASEERQDSKTRRIGHLIWLQDEA